MDEKDIFSNSSSNNEPEKQYENGFEDLHEDEFGADEVTPQNDSFDLNSFSSSAVDDALKKKNKKKLSKQRVIKITLLTMLIGVIFVVMVAGGILLYAFTMIDDSIEFNLNDLKINFTTTIYAENSESGEWEEYQRLHGEFNRIWVPYIESAAKDPDNTEYDGIPQRLADAFVAIEDKRFYSHYGVDWKRTFGAVINTVIPIYPSKQGGSTITQQLVKNLTGDNDQSAGRKVREIMRARNLEQNYTKDTILESYLNTIHLGHGLYGVEVAANYYFGKSVDELTLLECASLASIAKSSAYAPDVTDADGTVGRANKTRRETVLYLMLQEKYITQEEYDAALKEEFKIIASREELNETAVNNYYVDALIVEVTNDLAEKYGWSQEEAANNFYSGGYKIYATLDPDIQETVDSVFSNSELYGLEGKDGNQLQGAFTIMDYRGRILGMAGGIGEKTANLGHSGFNRATDAVRQPGSTMKPIAAYAPAIEDGIINYSSILNDTATNYNGWTPKNWYNTYTGGVTTQFALERSINTIPVYLVNKLTPQKCYNFVTQNLGISTLNENDINLSPLGMGGTNGGITTKESAAAFATFGNGGKYYEPTMYYKIYDQYNNVVLSKENVEPKVAMSEDTATVMNKMLQTVVYGSNGTGTGAAGYIPNMKIYAKTGTSNDANDLWFVGGSPYYVASCWCGYDQQQYVSDKAIARKMWGAVMSEIHKGLEARQFTVSKYASERYYCTETGLLATDQCPSKAIGWYTSHGIPKACENHGGTVLGTVEEVKQAAAEAQKTETDETTSSSAETAQ